MRTIIKIILISTATFLLSCDQVPTTKTVVGVTLKREFIDRDTIRKTADTIIVKRKKWCDTLVKYKPLSDMDYYVQPEEIKISKKLDFSTYEYKTMFITATTNGVKEDGTNFAGHYCFVYWGCGSPCKLSAVVDLKTGKVYNGLPSGIGYRFKKDSRLMVVNPHHSTNWYNVTVPYEIPEEYEWTGKKFKRIKTGS